MHFNPPGKGISLSRVSGDLDLSDEDAEVIFEKDAEGKKGAEVKKPMNVQAWIKDSSDKLN